MQRLQCCAHGLERLVTKLAWHIVAAVGHMRQPVDRMPGHVERLDLGLDQFSEIVAAQQLLHQLPAGVARPAGVDLLAGHVRKLLEVLHRLVDQGNSVVVIEHNLDVIKTADWIIDLGPEGGVRGGEIVAEGTPEDVAGNARSFTGHYLAPLLERARAAAE